MRPNHNIEDKLLYNLLIYILISFKTHPTEASRIKFDLVPGHWDLAKQTHQVNHHTGSSILLVNLLTFPSVTLFPFFREAIIICFIHPILGHTYVHISCVWNFKSVFYLHAVSCDSALPLYYLDELVERRDSGHLRSQRNADPVNIHSSLHCDRHHTTCLTCPPWGRRQMII